MFHHVLAYYIMFHNITLCFVMLYYELFFVPEPYLILLMLLMTVFAPAGSCFVWWVLGGKTQICNWVGLGWAGIWADCGKYF